VQVGLNIYLSACRDNQPIAYPGAMFAYGDPLLNLSLQILFLLVLLRWLDAGEVSVFPHTTARIGSSGIDGSGVLDEEEVISGGSLAHPASDVAAETERVAETETDLLRLLHVTKHFGSHRAVDDVSLGLGNGEILALLGPNGAGKTTIVNLIRGELSHDQGNILVKGVEVRGRTGEAQSYLGGKLYMLKGLRHVPGLLQINVSPL
jgi:ATP-binding cassette, subfamily A (ABC1), member 3